MNILKNKALLVAAALVALPVAASADTTPGWYAGAGAGMNFQETTGHNTVGVPSFSFDKPGYDLSANGGYAYENGLRLEGQYLRTNAVAKQDGRLVNNDLFANALYDFNMNSFLTPYIGAGVGVDFVRGENLGPAGTAHIGGDTTKFAYQGIVGVSAQVDQNWAVTADYRYVASIDPKLSTSTGTSARLDNASHNILFGVRYSFDTPAATPVRMTQAPKPQAKAAGKAAVAPVGQTYQVFFDFDKATLTTEAKQIIASAANDYKNGKYVHIVVTGHTDTKGKAGYNKALSERRAAAVKAEFASLGVDAKSIVTKGVGKAGLLVPTNDGVREAQNRRAEIVLEKK